MWILIRLALACGLGCIVARACGIEVPIPGDGDAFIETAWFVLIAVFVGELVSVAKDWIRENS